jgi:hypothetical protein
MFCFRCSNNFIPVVDHERKLFYPDPVAVCQLCRTKILSDINHAEDAQRVVRTDTILEELEEIQQEGHRAYEDITLRRKSAMEPDEILAEDYDDVPLSVGDARSGELDEFGIDVEVERNTKEKILSTEQLFIPGQNFRKLQKKKSHVV